MGIDFYCGEKTWACSYGDWNIIRIQIITATLDYIEDKYEKDKELYGNLTEDNDNWIGEGSEYYCYMKDLLQLKTMLLSLRDTINGLINTFIGLCHNLHYMNSLNYFDIGGLFALCNQSDCEGFYTPGNSLDICSLFDRIEPFTKKYDCYNNIYILVDEDSSYKLYEVFEYSYKTLNKVTIA